MQNNTHLIVYTLHTVKFFFKLYCSFVIRVETIVYISSQMIKTKRKNTIVHTSSWYEFILNEFNSFVSAQKQKHFSGGFSRNNKKRKKQRKHCVCYNVTKNLTNLILSDSMNMLWIFVGVFFFLSVNWIDREVSTYIKMVNHQ